MEIVKLSTFETVVLTEAATRAVSENRPFRIARNGEGVSWKVGSGTWSPVYGKVED